MTILKSDVTFTMTHTICSPETLFFCNETPHLSFSWNLRKTALFSETGEMLYKATCPSMRSYKMVVSNMITNQSICNVNVQVNGFSIGSRKYVATFDHHVYAIQFVKRHLKIYSGESLDKSEIADLKLNWMGIAKSFKIKKNEDPALMITLISCALRIFARQSS
eukprot:NODE_127_length_17034_cov_0.369590.p14 type:complete len:164 gc:universal NODE_127_length_17034_cov_0.369590:5152-5643(+)